jgi:hypothetical protein
MLVGPLWFWQFLTSAKIPKGRNYRPLCSHPSDTDWEMEPRMLGLTYTITGVFGHITNLFSYISQHPNIDWSHVTFLPSLRNRKEDRKERMNWFSQKANDCLYHSTWMINVPVWRDVGVWWKMSFFLGRVMLHWGVLPGNLWVTNLNRTSIGL